MPNDEAGRPTCLTIPTTMLTSAARVRAVIWQGDAGADFDTKTQRRKDTKGEREKAAENVAAAATAIRGRGNRTRGAHRRMCNVFALRP